MAKIHQNKFRQMEQKLSHSNHKPASDEGALAAFIGRKKFGKAGMAAKAAAGRKRAAGK